MIGQSPHLELLGVLDGHVDGVMALAFHQTEPRLASGSKDRAITLWDLDLSVEVAKLRGHSGHVRDLAFDGAGARLASASGGFRGTDNVGRLWETELNPATRLRRARIMRAHGEVLRVCRSSVKSPDEAKRRIEEDLSLPESIRKEALDRFENLLPLRFDPAYLARQAEDTTKDSEATPKD